MKEPSRTSPPSSQAGPPAVNAEAPLRSRIDVRRFLRSEKGVRRYRPTPRPAPPKPTRADEVLDALAVAYRPGDRIGLEHITATGGICHGIASAIRKWAQHEGRWPYRDRISGFAAMRDKDPVEFYGVDAEALAASKRRRGDEP